MIHLLCHNVQIESLLLTIESDREREGNTADKARLDVAGVGFWGSYEKTFLDIDHAPQLAFISQQTN